LAAAAALIFFRHRRHSRAAYQVKLEGSTNSSSDGPGQPPRPLTKEHSLGSQASSQNSQMPLRAGMAYNSDAYLVQYLFLVKSTPPERNLLGA
jgi:hypothetical protein